jgi:hypothetical protein
MQTSQKLFAILQGVHGAACDSSQRPSPLDDLLATYLATAIPVAQWLEHAGVSLSLEQFVVRPELAKLLETPTSVAGPLFPAICAPLQLALDQFPDDAPIEFAGLNPPNTIPGLGYLCVRASELILMVEQQIEASAQPHGPATNLTDFSSIPMRGWFKADFKGEWQRKTGPTTGSMVVNGVKQETQFFEYDPVFTE